MPHLYAKKCIKLVSGELHKNGNDRTLRNPWKFHSRVDGNRCCRSPAGM